jgi:hypothetical protein
VVVSFARGDFGGYLAVRIVLDGSAGFAGIVSGGMRDRSFLPI